MYSRTGGLGARLERLFQEQKNLGENLIIGDGDLLQLYNVLPSKAYIESVKTKQYKLEHKLFH